jgi:hypothetical protein
MLAQGQKAEEEEKGQVVDVVGDDVDGLQASRWRWKQPV